MRGYKPALNVYAETGKQTRMFDLSTCFHIYLYTYPL
jgi:hypothetical protein